MNRLASIFVLFVSCWLIAACSPSGLPKNYQFFAPFIEEKSIQINHERYRYPSKRDFQFFEGAVPIDLTTIWRWNSHCPDLSLLAAKRNNQLGKTMVPSQKFGYEIKVLNQLDHCIHTMQNIGPDNTALKEDLLNLQSIYLKKLTDSWTMMMATLWNDDSVRYFLKGENTAINIKEIQTGQSFKNWLTLIAISDHVLKQEFTAIEKMDIESILFKIQQQNSGGIILRHMQFQLSILKNQKSILANACQTLPSSDANKQWKEFHQLAIQTQTVARQMFSSLTDWLNQPSLPSTIGSYWQGVLDLMQDHQATLTTVSAELDVCSTHAADSK